MSQRRNVATGRQLPPMPGLTLEEMQKPPVWRTLVLYVVTIGGIVAFIFLVDLRERREQARLAAPVEMPSTGVAGR